MMWKVAVLVCVVCVLGYRAWIKGKRKADAGVGSAPAYGGRQPAIGLNGTLVNTPTGK